MAGAQPVSADAADPAPAGVGAALDVVYQDDAYVVIDKPAGLLVHRTGLDAGETRFAVQTLRDQLGRHVHPCHRLDKPTSGLLLFALDADALREARRLFEAREVEKEYLAVVRGWVPEGGTIDRALREADEAGRLTGEGREAVTRFARVACGEVAVPFREFPTSRYALVRLHPETGRRHQLRRHLRHLGHPIVGDTAHGDAWHNRLFRERFGCGRLLLAATRLAFVHPRTGVRVDLRRSPGPDFTGPATACGCWPAG